jgi:hypothetical protein
MSEDAKTAAPAARRFCVRAHEGCGDDWCKASKRNDSKGLCVYEYDEAKINANMKYHGEDWPPPRRWRAMDGTIVYRTYADYVND